MVFQDGISELLSEISPVEDFTGKNWSLELLENIILINPDILLKNVWKKD